jgi:phosphatidylserine/phosphatidylglycerophosphate/cardiolipin synthase-like enzyme
LATSESARLAAELVLTLNGDLLVGLIHGMAAGHLRHGQTAYELRQRTGLSGASLDRLVRLLASDNAPQDMAIALDAARIATELVQIDSPTVELVWTGPPLQHLSARKTLAVLEELVDSAVSEVILLGYSITGGASLLFTKLATAAHRGVKVVIIGNRLEDHLAFLKQLWPRDLPGPEYYSKPPDPDDHMAALHAKFLVVDSRDMLVTSANFTEHGLALNVEIGLRVRGEVVRDLREIVFQLTNEGVIRRLY